MMKATNGIGQRYIKGDTKDCILVESWFSSNSLAEAAMEVGANFISMV